MSNDRAQRDELGRFITGNNGGGRPKGSRNKLGEQLISDLYADWMEHGPAAIAAMRRQKPAEYVKVVAAILPKEVKVNERPLEEMSTDEIRDAIARIDEVRSALLEQDDGATNNGIGSEETGKPH